MEGGGRGGLGLYCVTGLPLGLCRGTVRNGLCTRMSGTCVTCADHETRRVGGVIGCAATCVVTWVSSFVRVMVAVLEVGETMESNVVSTRTVSRRRLVNARKL